MAAVVQRVLPMLCQPLNFSSKLSFSQPDIVWISLSNPPSSSVSLAPQLIYCGRGDKKTAKGKRFRHSFGNARPRDKKKGRGPPRPPMPASPPKKDRVDEDDDC